MTTQELDNAFKLYLNKVDSMGTADFLPLERQQFLNDAQLRIAKRICSKKSQDQDAVDMRRTLGTPFNNSKQLDVYGEAYVELPVDYLHYEALWVTELLPTDTIVRHKPLLVAEDELLNILNDPFNKPTSIDPVLCFFLNRLYIYPSTCYGIVGGYYREPRLLDLATPDTVCELPNPLCQLLVQEAVQLALESIQDSRFQTQNAILQSTPIT